ncbi:hypothetical protein MF271_12600 [Deinococcus sp. KNUC1210]|uniref:hypothetical protein n=1 Tax=Deinococcus sp. KNUC1210 TaxID=2917691 RepID=UPI001EF0C8D0|nr:hypothetical protein [Deinococcus sp. KNUC1210]ULH14816.1 hypothetical protein MF271_12600 [Deinococcus sp. KNUC1210]
MKELHRDINLIRSARRGATATDHRQGRQRIIAVCLLCLLTGRGQAALPGLQLSPAPPPPIPLLSLPEPPLRVVGSTPTWAGTAVFDNLPPQDAAAELYAGRADLVLGTLPLPAPPAGIDAPISLPVGVFAVSVVYQLPGVALRLDIPALCALLNGQISQWNAPALRALNPGVTLPALPVLLSARVARNGVSLAVAGTCVKAGVWPVSQLKSNWTARAAFTRATLGAQKSDLNIPGALALFSPLDVPPGAQVALLRSPGAAMERPEVSWD